MLGGMQADRTARRKVDYLTVCRPTYHRAVVNTAQGICRRECPIAMLKV